MRLISCHIENFGKLHDFDMTFPEGITVICRENGWGKSTLATFIKAMLYGLDGDRKRGLDDNERKRYKPWQGGIFGGRMEFETGSRQYTVTRTFGDSAAKDTFELRDGRTNLVSRDFSERLGEELFRLNSASFCRSIFIGQGDCRTSATDDIHAKIGNLADNTDDMNSYESAEKRLTRQINRLSPNRTTGSLYALEEEIARLRRKVAEGTDLSDMIANCEKEMAQKENGKRVLLALKSEAERKQKKAFRMQQLSMKRAEWERLKQAVVDTQDALDAARAKFPGGIPDEDGVKKALHSVVEIKSAECLMSSYALSPDEEDLLDVLHAKLTDNPPSQSEIDLHLNEEQELRRILEKYERIRLTSSERTSLDRLSSDFASDTITPSELASAWSERCAKKDALSSKRDAFNTVNASFRKSLSSARWRSAGIITLGVLLMLLGIGLFIWLGDLWYIGASVTGSLILSAGILYAVSINMKAIPEQVQRLNDEIELDVQFIDTTDSTAEEYLHAHGISFNENYVQSVLQELCSDRRDLDALTKKAEIADNYLRNSSYLSLDKSINDFLIGFGIIPDNTRLSEQLFELKENVGELEALTNKKERYDDAKMNYFVLTEQIKDFLASIGRENSSDFQEELELIRDDLAEYNRITRHHLSATTELELFESSMDLSSLEAADQNEMPSPEAIADEIADCSEKLESLSRDISLLHRKREELSLQFSQWESDRFELSEKTGRQSADRLKLERLIKARNLLRQAKENMTAKYIRPVSDASKRYHGLVDEISPDRYCIDADIKVTVNDLGQQREIDSLSTGYRDLTGVCLRLALADAMYRDEKPTLVMDDPFTNLDDSKIAASANLLNAVSENYQVIYFTCSTARTAKICSGQWLKTQN